MAPHTLAQRPDLAEDLDRPELNPGPSVMFNDTISRDLWPHLATEFSGFQLALTQDDQVIARANSLPLAWHGSEHDLPQGGFAWTLRQAFDDHIVTGALAPVTIDIHADCGTYTEPNVWAWHQLEPSP